VAVTPVQKVVQMLNHMVQKGTEDKQAEEIQFARYKSFCTNTISHKQSAIDKNNELMEVLSADIEKFEAEAARLTEEIAQQDLDIATWEGDSVAATKVREIENADYIATTKDYTSSINAVDEGIAYIHAQQKDVVQGNGKGASALNQLKTSSLVPDHAREIIAAYLHKGVSDENLAVAAPEARAYESQTEGVTDLLTGLGGKFEGEKVDVHEEEGEAKHNFEVLIKNLRFQIDSATTSRSEKAKAKARYLQKAANAKGQLVDATGTRDADTKYMDDLDTTCQKKSSDFANRQQLMTEELTAIEKAIEILSSGAVAGNSEKNLPQFMQLKQKSGTALLQIKADSQNPAQIKVAAFLKEQGMKFNSRLLSALSTRVSSDPFRKVKKMIKDLVVKLMEEAAAESEHKGWCDTELSTNAQTREEKTEAVELLSSEIDELDASINSLAEQLADLTSQVAELNDSMSKATAERSEERAQNKQVISEAKEAQAAVDRAVAVLTDFYAKAADATSLAQVAKRQRNSAEPEIFDEPYQGMGAENGGVLGMLAVIGSDFDRLESDTTAAEEASQADYDSLMSDSKVDQQKKQSDIQHKSDTKGEQEHSLQEKKNDLAGNQKELDAAMAYFGKLKSSCIETGVSFEDRVKRRKEEMESLQTALRILNNEDV